MRLVAQTKLGFYPAHPDAVGRICKHLTPPADRADMTTLLDPCAGDGKALLQIASHLAVPARRVYAVELDNKRALDCKVLLPDSKVLGPASFLGTNVSPGSFSVVYCNPPFDDEIGGGKRVEYTFAEHATTLLRTGGVLVLVLPISAIQRNDSFQHYLDSNYDQAALFRFPAEHRHFKEVVYFGVRRPKETPAFGRGHLRRLELSYREPAEVVGDSDYAVTPPWAHAPGVWKKIELTDGEILDGLEKSPLLKHFAPPKLLTVKRPPADLSTGHVSLLLASGLLNGVVRPPGEPPHVVRGTARKVDYQPNPPEVTEGERGATTVKETISQKILLTVRAVGQDGEIMTFEEGGAK